jgi:hypothetical protein
MSSLRVYGCHASEPIGICRTAPQSQGDDSPPFFSFSLYFKIQLFDKLKSSPVRFHPRCRNLAMTESSTRALAASRLQPADGTTATYMYQALETDHHFRLLHFENGKFEMIHANLHSPPKYETISYVWGLPNFDYRLQLASGENIAITESLYGAIPFLAAVSRTGYLWIDQLCIHQADVVEKNNQVFLMAQIYRSCDRVLIWLGLEDDDTKALKHVMRKMEDLYPACNVNAPIKTLINTPHPNGDLQDSQLQEARGLIKRPWFKRAWVVQEASLPPEALMVMGSLCYDFLWLVEAFISALSLIEPGGPVETKGLYLVGFLHMWRTRISCQNGVSLHLLLNILSPLLEASNQHDLIYGEFGILQHWV